MHLAWTRSSAACLPSSPQPGSVSSASHIPFHIAFTTSVRFCSLLFTSPLNFTISQWSHKSMSSMKSWVSTGSDTWERLWDLVRNNALNGFGRQQCCHSVLGTVEPRWQDMTNSYCFDHSTPMTMWTICHLHHKTMRDNAALYLYKLGCSWQWPDLSEPRSCWCPHESSITPAAARWIIIKGSFHVPSEQGNASNWNKHTTWLVETPRLRS